MSPTVHRRTLSLSSTFSRAHRVGIVAIFASALAAACAEPRASAIARTGGDSLASQRADSLERARQDSINRAQPGYVVDSILPVEEEVRRFRAAIGGAAVFQLAGGASSTKALLDRLSRAVTAADTSALRELALSAREFIDLVYPSSPYTKPPYHQSPGLLWRQIQLPSTSGARRLLARHGGEPMRITALRCQGRPESQGANRLYVGCTVRFSSGAAALREGRLFGSIIERGGQYKFVSYANMY